MNKNRTGEYYFTWSLAWFVFSLLSFFIGWQSAVGFMLSFWLIQSIRGINEHS